MGTWIKCHFSVGVHQVYVERIFYIVNLNLFRLINFLLPYSFITVTFVIEAMASANAIVMWRHMQHRKRVSVFQLV